MASLGLALPARSWATLLRRVVSIVLPTAIGAVILGNVIIYIIYFCIPLIRANPQAAVLHHIVFWPPYLTLCWTFYKAIFAQPLAPEALFIPDEGAKQTICDKCNVYKPPRTHHCSICQQCILRMDHHCIWLANCIGEHNYKFFVLLLFYCSLVCGGVAATTVPLHLRWIGFGIHPWLIFVRYSCFGLSAVSTPFVAFHFFLIAINRTTLEFIGLLTGFYSYRSVPNFDRGLLNNFKDVFGKNILMWPVPVINPEERTKWKIISDPV